MSRRSVAFFCMPEAGHFQRLRSLIAGVAGCGAEAHVFTDPAFRDAVEASGGTFVDLFARYPLADADGESMPMPCRFVSFAGHYAEAIAADAAALRPGLVVHDTFAVIGWVVAAQLGVPHVAVCAGHDVAPERFLVALERDPRVKIGPRCRQAVATLRERHGIADASPFSYVSCLSRHLNLYCEPPEFLDEDQRAPFAPIAFWGSLPPAERWPPAPTEGARRSSDGVLRLYVSFGTVVWRYFAAQARAALETMANVFAAMPQVQARISLGGSGGGGAATDLERPNVAVDDYVDQWDALRDADVFVTHHGLNSTHEAILHGVPMVSYPFFWDQPALAAKCQRFGLAVPLAEGLRAPLVAAEVEAALAAVATRRPAMERALATARGWEAAVVAERPRVLRRMLALAA